MPFSSSVVRVMHLDWLKLNSVILSFGNYSIMDNACSLFL
jgi:hypothetical protein